MESKTFRLFLGMLAFLFILVSLSFTSAEMHLNWSVAYKVIENDLSSNLTNIPVNGFDVKGFVCLTPNCTSIGSQVLSLSGHSNTSNIVLTFPTNLMNPNGYVLYFYKQGYIGWEQINVTVYGTNSNIIPASTVYLAQKRSGFAPLSNFSITNSAYTHRLIEFNVSALINATTYSALYDRHVSGITLNASERVNTNVGLEIRNANGTLVNSQLRNYLINTSSYENVRFNYTFLIPGNYSVRVYSLVNDSKIINSLLRELFANLVVIDQNATNYSYSLVQNLAYTPLMPSVNQLMNFSCNVLSNYVDSVANYNVLNTSVTHSFYRNGSLYYLSNHTIEGVNPLVYNSFNFSRLFNETGDYTWVVSVSPVNGIGTIISDSKNLTFYVGNYSGNNTNFSSNSTFLNVVFPVNGTTYYSTSVSLNVLADWSSNINRILYSLDGVSFNGNFTQNMTINFSYGWNNLTLAGYNGSTLLAVSDLVRFNLVNDSSDDSNSSNNRNHRSSGGSAYFDEESGIIFLDNSSLSENVISLSPSREEEPVIDNYLLLNLVLILLIIVLVLFVIYVFTRIR